MLFNVVPLKILFPRKCPPLPLPIYNEQEDKVDLEKLHANMSL
jgi:hypothetical protein